MMEFDQDRFGPDNDGYEDYEGPDEDWDWVEEFGNDVVIEEELTDDDLEDIDDLDIEFMK